MQLIYDNVHDKWLLMFIYSIWTADDHWGQHWFHSQITVHVQYAEIPERVASVYNLVVKNIKINFIAERDKKMVLVDIRLRAKASCPFERCCNKWRQ